MEKKFLDVTRSLTKTQCERESLEVGITADQVMEEITDSIAGKIDSELRKLKEQQSTLGIGAEDDWRK